MGTNFYLYTSKKVLKPLLGSRAELVDEPDFGYEIHIAKTSAGWQPLFEAHEHIKSVEDLKNLYELGNGDCKIYDEYGKEYTWEGFVERVVNFGNEFNWRTLKNNDKDRYYYFMDDIDEYEFISVDGYRFSTTQFC